MHVRMLDVSASPIHALSSGLCEDVNGESLALIRRIARRDPAALADLFANWGPVLLGIACRMLGDRREANDVLHRTFHAIWKRSADYDPHQSPPFVWALVIMRGLAIDRLRRGNGSRNARPPASANRGENPKTLSSDDCTRLRSAIDQLDPEDRRCLESAVFLDFASGAGADTTASVAVKNRLRRALDLLRNQLSRHEL
jgi:RNA polymerase sigma-70 factor (ECF subfamily)